MSLWGWWLKRALWGNKFGFLNKKLGYFGVSKENWVVVSNIFYFHPYLGKTAILTNIFQRGWFNHQPENMCFFITPTKKHVCFCGSRLWEKMHGRFFFDKSHTPKLPGGKIPRWFFFAFLYLTLTLPKINIAIERWGLSGWLLWKGKNISGVLFVWFLQGVFGEDAILMSIFVAA